MQQRFVVSQRRVCADVGQPRATERYVPRESADEAALTARIVALATRFGRYGYRRVTALLHRLQGITVDDGTTVSKQVPCGPIYDLYEKPLSGWSLTNISCITPPPRRANTDRHAQAWALTAAGTPYRAKPLRDGNASPRPLIGSPCRP